ncbi:hypothetical protein Aglo03_04810 [Actinokineospora globicatena]|uniref:Uncharacterized protein n=1 Tax=Actinokineospora globicatena TaxID=103729 RepID=A0A9W6QJ69_9PSEU|nr:hypothetical protein Aglo03_04810 [Actinokineospora globicatena]
MDPRAHRRAIGTGDPREQLLAREPPQPPRAQYRFHDATSTTRLGVVDGPGPVTWDDGHPPLPNRRYGDLCQVCQGCQCWYKSHMSFTGVANPRRTRLIDLHPEPAVEQVGETAETVSPSAPAEELDATIQS